MVLLDVVNRADIAEINGETNAVGLLKP